ncbi:hypothetical protein ACU8MP_34050 (plasmid) [Rhizobium leguminosarum]|nr:hypothetical protein [Rhizobium leguminosarum]MBA9034523.1 hypothetical protein [Rhizobium leguminosarum]
MKRADGYMYLAKQTGERLALVWLGHPGLAHVGGRMVRSRR